MKKQTIATRRNAIESLEPRTLCAAYALDVDFTKAGAAVFPGFTADTGLAYGSRSGGQTFGWSSDNTKNTRDRNSAKAPNQAYDTVSYMQTDGVSRKWEVAVPNGTYTVRVVAGDAAVTGRRLGIAAEGTTVLSGTTTASKLFYDGTVTVRVTDGKLTLSSTSAGRENVLAFARITGTTDTTPPPVTAGAWPKNWTKAADSPVNRFEAYGFSYGGKLYVMGGWANYKFESLTRVDVYDPKTNKWTRLADMKAPETHAGTAVDEAHGVVYFVGGHRGDYPSVPSNEVWKYTIAGDKWEKLPVTLPKVLGANAVEIANGKLHSFSGVAEDRVTNIGDHYVLDLSNISAGFKTAAPLPLARDHLSSAVINNQIYALGGEFGHDRGHDQQNILQRYDAASDTWVRLADAPISKSHAESSTFVLNGKIIWAGGQTDPQSPTNNASQYDPVTNQWTTLTPIPSARQGTIIQRVGDYIVITTGGVQTNQPQNDTWVSKIVT